MKITEEVQQLISKIDAMPEKVAEDIDIPIRLFTQTTALILEAARRDQEVLKENKYDISKLDEIELHIDALTCQQAIFNDVRFDNPETARQFNEEREEGIEIRYELLAAMGCAFAEDPNLMAKLSRIREGGSNADLIQDLMDIKAICESNLELLNTVKYEESYLERIPTLSKSLLSLLSKATLDRSESPEVRILRDKIYTILKKMVIKLSRTGLYAFRHKPKYASRYSMTYTPRGRKPKKKNTPKAETVA
jgi:hypothetical protein